MKLLTILVLGFIFITLIGNIFIIFSITSNSENILKMQVYDNLQAISQNIERTINTFIDGQENKIELIATQSELTNEELKNMITLDNSFYELFVINSSGKIIASSNEMNIGVDKSNDSYFLNARNQSYIKPIYFSNSTQQYSFTISTPFHSGVLVGRVDAEYLNSLTRERIGLGETGESLLAFINEKDKFVYFSERRFSDNPVEVLTLDQVMGRPIYNAVIGKEGISSNLKDYRGVIVISSANYIEKLKIGMVTKIDESEALGKARDELIRISVIISIVMILLVIIFAFIISFLISKPLKKLKNDVDEITKGKLDIQLSKSRINEIQGLIDSLNRILATMKLAILRTGISKSDLGMGEVVKAKEEAEKKYAVIFDDATDQIFSIDKNLKYVSANKTTILNLGKKKEEDILGKSIYDISPKNIAQQFEKNLMVVFNTGKSISLEEIIKLPHRKVKVSTRLNPIKDENGKVKMVLGIVRELNSENEKK